MDSPRSFWAGGAVVLLPAGTRQRIFARPVLMPGYNVELHEMGAGSQQTSDFFLFELINGGKTVLSEMFLLGFASAGYALPFLSFEAQGTLELFVTNPGGIDTTISAHTYGIYVPRY